MTLTERIRTQAWWWWAASLALLIVGLAGLRSALPLFVLLSALHAVIFILRERMSSLSAQVRVVYFLAALAGVIDPTRIVLLLLLVGTCMVVLFDRCAIAVVLRKMPWNRPPQSAG